MHGTSYSGPALNIRTELQELPDAVPLEFLEGLLDYVQKLHAPMAKAGTHGGH